MSEEESAPLTFGQIIEKRKDGFSKKQEINIEEHDHKKPKSMKRLNKNAPQEISSKHFVREKKEILNKHEIRDPRFENLCGKYNDDLFRKSYKFIEEQQSVEAKELKNKMFREKNEYKKRRIQADLTRIVQQQQNRQRRDKMIERKHEYKQKESEAVAKGKKPYFMKKSVLKQEELKDRFENLRKRGKLIYGKEEKKKF
ncbi:hypothetical protein WA158_000389 [Blastocystis sp. Blastoise]